MMLLDSGIESGSSPELRHHRIPHHQHHHHHKDHDPHSMSRTHQYRKVMKPLLERKRRARINKCLDELKDIMVVALQSEGESITKLEKADVLELTVRHMQKLKSQDKLGLTPQATYAGKFKAGYAHCVHEVSRFMTTQALAVDGRLSGKLIRHLSSCAQTIEALPTSACISAAAPAMMVAPSPLLTPPQETKTASEDIALDLSSRKRPRAEDEDDEDSLCRKRQLSNDSDSGNSSMGLEPEEKRGKREEEWRPW